MSYLIRLGLLGLLSAGGLGACSRSRVNAAEGVGCSTSKDDNPYYSCDETAGLSCVTTEKRPFTKNDAGTFVDVYVCRQGCSATTVCLWADDVCCPGVVYPTGATATVCVPRGKCDAKPIPTTPKPSQPTYVGEGASCTASAAANPQRLCDDLQQLVCATSAPADAGADTYQCRKGCGLYDESCESPLQECCPSRAATRNLAVNVCVPLGTCGEAPIDAGPRDGSASTGVDAAGGDVPTGDSGPDATAATPDLASILPGADSSVFDGSPD